MSAWIVSKKHIDVLVSGLIEYGGYRYRGKWVNVNEDNADEVGRMLWAENHKSIRARYGGSVRTPTYIYTRPTPYFEMVRVGGQILIDGKWVPNDRKVMKVDKGVLAKQMSCYDYQTCEHETYYNSRAYFAMSSMAEFMLSSIPGYDGAKWGV